MDDEPDRDTWCTPLKWARALGRVYLDPCWNERSHIDARITFDFEGRGQNALLLARYIAPKPPGLVFVNPPYSRGQLIQFVEAFAHTRFCFLVRMDTSTVWWAKLWPRVELMCVPKRRVNFEPPPGVPNPGVRFPHVFLFARSDDATTKMRRMCYVNHPDHAMKDL